MRIIWRLLGLIRRSIAWLLVAVLITTNVLAFTSAAFVGMVSAAVGAVGVTTVAAREAARATARRVAVQRAANRVAVRTARRAGRTVAGVPLKALPVVGGAAVVTFAAWEVYDACQTMLDLADLDDDPLDVEVEMVCGMPYPTMESLWNSPAIGIPAMPPHLN